MPYDSNGKYSLPPIYKATTGEKVLAEQHNIPLEDVAQALSQCIKRDGSTPGLRNQSLSGFLITDMGDARNPGDAVNKRMLDAMIPVGSIQAFAGGNPPPGWLLCGGQAVSRATYAALFSVVGGAFGSGDGGSTFNLPDFRGRVLVGRDDMGGPAANRVTPGNCGINGGWIGSAGGAESIVLTEAQMPYHRHEGNTAGGGGHNHQGYDSRSSMPGAGQFLVSSNGEDGPMHAVGTTGWAGDHIHYVETNFKGGNGAHMNVQPSIIINYIIRTGV